MRRYKNILEGLNLYGVGKGITYIDVFPILFGWGAISLPGYPGNH